MAGRVGILVPRSLIHPRLGMDFVSGIRHSLSQFEGEKPELFIEEVGFGSMEDNVIEKSQKLMLQHQVDVVIGFFSCVLIPSLRDLHHNNRIPMFMVNLGATVPAPIESSPYFHYYSAGLWRAAYNLGEWTAQHLGSKTAVISDFYESGYPFSAMFQNGFQANGGDSLSTALFREDPSDQDLIALCRQLIQSDIDFVTSFTNHKTSNRLEAILEQELAALDDSKTMDMARLLLDLEPEVQPVHSKHLRIIEFGPWSSTHTSRENKVFMQSYEEAFDETANIFVALGFDALEMIRHCIITQEGSFKKRISKGLQGITYKGISGAISTDPRIDMLLGSTITQQVEPGDGGSTKQKLDVFQHNEPDRSIEAAAEYRQQMTSGWLNPYLCV